MDPSRRNYLRHCSVLFPIMMIAAYVFGYILYRTVKAGIVDPYNSMVDIRVLLGLSAANVVFLVLFYKRAINLVFLTVQLVMLLFIITLTNSNLAITAVLATAFLFASGYYLKRPANLVFSLLAAVTVLAFQRSIRIDALQTPAVNPTEVIMLGFLFTLVTILNYLISSIIESHEALIRLIGEQRGTIVNLIETNVGIQKYAFTKKEEFESAERLRITRDIHDTVGYVLTNNITLLRACSYYVPTRLKKAHTFLEDALTNAQKGLNETRAILKKLHDMDRIRGTAEIVKIIRLFKESTGINVTYNPGNTPRTWGRELDYVFYRIVQEGLVNSVKHGKATAISISFWQTETEIVLNITDNGTGDQDGEPKEGMGLRGMQERLTRFNGTLDARGYPHGFLLCVRVPLDSLQTEVANETHQADVR